MPSRVFWVVLPELYCRQNSYLMMIIKIIVKNSGYMTTVSIVLSMIFWV